MYVGSHFVVSSVVSFVVKVTAKATTKATNKTLTTITANKLPKYP